MDENQIFGGLVLSIFFLSIVVYVIAYYVWPPDVKKLREKQNVGGLIRALNYRFSDTIRAAAVQAMQELVEARIADLNLEGLEERRTAAGSLVALHKTGKLDERCQRLILEQREKIQRGHIDRAHYDHTSYSDCTSHSDTPAHDDAGIGVPFPLWAPSVNAAGPPSPPQGKGQSISFLQGLFGPPNVDRLKAEGDIKWLVKALDYKRDATIRLIASVALEQEIEPLVGALDDKDLSKRRAAARSSVEI